LEKDHNVLGKGHASYPWEKNHTVLGKGHATYPWKRTTMFLERTCMPLEKGQVQLKCISSFERKKVAAATLLGVR